MATRSEAYVDTSALISFLERNDQYHDLFRRLFASPPPLITTPLVVAEGQAWCLRRYSRARAMQFVTLIESLSSLTIHTVGPLEQVAGIAVVRRFADQELTLVDAIGLYLMKKRCTEVCWSTDFHLGLTGVPLAIHRT